MTTPDSHPEDLFQQMLESMESGEISHAGSARLLDAPPELAVLVNLALQMRAAATPPPDPGPALARARQRVLASLPDTTAPELVPPVNTASTSPAERRPRTATPGWWERLMGALRLPPVPAWAAITAVVVILIGLATFTTVRVSAAALPGQPLYPVKRATETVILFLVRNPETRAKLEQTYEDHRRDEINDLFERGWQESVDFTGALIGREEQGWRIDKWLVVGSDADFAQLPAGALVRVKGITTADGHIQAHAILIVQLPTPSPTPTETPTLRPDTGGATPRPTATRRSAPNVRPPATRQPTAPPRATRTPRPSATPQPTPTPSITTTSTPAVLVYTGIFRAVSGGLITVDAEQFRLAPTVGVTGIRVGSRVRVHYRLLLEGDKLAIGIDLLATPETTPRPASVQVAGEIASLEGGRIVVGGLSFRITGETAINGRLEVGRQASVKGHYDADDDLVADEITMQELPSVVFSGIIQSIQGSRLSITSPFGAYIVDIGQAVIAGTPVIGAGASGHGRQQPDGVIIAESITITAPDDTPTPDTGDQTATPTVAPVDSPTPTQPPPTDTPEPTNTPVPPADTSTPRPTEPPPTPTREPTEPPPTPTAEATQPSVAE